MEKLCEVGRWYSIPQLKLLQTQVDAQDELIEKAQEYIGEEMEALEDEVRSLKHEAENLEDYAFTIPSDVETLQERGMDMVRYYVDPNEKPTTTKDYWGRTRSHPPTPHLEFANSERRVFVRTFKRDKDSFGKYESFAEEFKATAIEEPLESAPK